jgi:hypothetical protein
MASDRRASRRPTRDPGWRPSRRSDGNGAGPSYTPVVWACDLCGASVTDQASHDRFHAALAALWERAR